MNTQFKGSETQFYPIEFAGYIRIMDQPFYDGNDLLNVEDVGRETAEANAMLLSSSKDLLNAFLLLMTNFKYNE